jgi:hypothetical protein
MNRAKLAALFSICAAALAAGPSTLFAASRDFAVGVTLGSPTGLTVLQNISETEAVQVAFELNIVNTWVLQGDYLFKTRFPAAIPPENGKAWIYYGPGLRWEWGGREQFFSGPYRTSDEGRFALRFPVGLQYYVPKVPFDIFAEVAPMLSLWESTAVDMTMAIGVRFNL